MSHIIFEVVGINELLAVSMCVCVCVCVCVYLCFVVSTQCSPWGCAQRSATVRKSVLTNDWVTQAQKPGVATPVVSRAVNATENMGTSAIEYCL